MAGRSSGAERLRPRVRTAAVAACVALLLAPTVISAQGSVQGIVTKDVARDLISIEDQLEFDTEEEIEGLTNDEKKELIDVLNQKYAVGT